MDESSEIDDFVRPALDSPGLTPQLIDAWFAALQISTEIDLPVILQRLVNLAREVVPSKYAALGVSDNDGRILQFITSGISAATRAAIGPIPQGHGLLGALIQDREPLMVSNIASDPRSVGFPPHHPPMRTLLGVPIMLGNRVMGDLYLTEHAGGEPYSEEDLAALRILAAHAATTIERARLLKESRDAHHLAAEQRDHLETILASMPTAVLILANPDGAIESANAAARSLMLGHRHHPGLPVPMEDYWFEDPDGGPIPPQHWPGRRSLTGEVVRNKQLNLVLAEGQKIPVLIQGAPLRDSQGAVQRAVVIMQDITRLREAEQLKDDFLSLVSHEMRTPLTAIHGGASLLSTHGDSLDPETRRELLSDILIESTRLERTLANILALTGIQAGRVEPSTEPVLLRQFLESVIESARPLVAAHHVMLEVEPGLPPAEGDPELLAHVVRNLIENAAKYSAAGSRICLSARRAADGLTVNVEDEGHGIAKEHLPFVFDRFRRPGADPTIRGMGLGLYLSRSLVDAMGGTLRVKSDGPGKGTCFTVGLPIATGWSDLEEIES